MTHDIFTATLPTGIALRGGEVYVLEWTNANGGANDGWCPCVRKVATDGTVTVLVTIQENGKANR